MKKLLSIALAVIMLLAAVPTVALAVTYIDKVSIDFVTPKVGETATTENIMDDDYGCHLKNAKWLDAASDVYLSEDETFKAGEYIIEATFEAESGYKFKKAESVEVIINGVEADKVEKNLDGTLTASLKFTCEEGGIKLPSLSNLFANIKTILTTFVRFIGSLLGLK